MLFPWFSACGPLCAHPLWPGSVHLCHQSSRPSLTPGPRIRTDPRKWGLRTINSTHRYLSSSLTSSHAAHSFIHLWSRGLLQTPQPCPTLQAQKMQILILLTWKSWNFWETCLVPQFFSSPPEWELSFDCPLKAATPPGQLEHLL